MRGPARRSRARRRAAAIMAVVGAGLVVASPVVAEGEVRTQTELFGYSLEADATPLTVRFFENFIPIPTDPGDPQFEMTASYAKATLGTGPNGRAVASSIWPGAALGDGFGTVVGDESQTYPIRASATYPGGGEADWQQSSTVPGLEGFGMHASARGLDVVARSEGGGLPGAADVVASFGQLRSEAAIRVEEAEAIATSVSSIGRVRLLDGVIVLNGVTTEVTARSDGETASTDGLTTISGIEVLGVPIRLTDRGVVIVPPEDGEDPVGALLDPANQVVQQLTDDLVADGIEDVLGIRIEALDHQETVDGALSERLAGGVRITVDVSTLRGYLDPVLALVPLSDILRQVPDEAGDLKGLLFELLGLGPEIEFVVGRGTAAAAATPPFELPDLPPPPPLPPIDSGPVSSGGTALPPPSGGLSLPPPSATGGPPTQPPPAVAPPAGAPPTPPVLAAAQPEPFQGIPIALAGVALMLLAVPTWGLRTVREAAVGLSANTAVPHQLPDLRGGA